MSQFIDKRHTNRHKSAVNRRRFLQRFKHQIRKSVSDAISRRSMTDVDQGEKVEISNKDTHEPSLHHSNGGVITLVLPGNNQFVRGDKIPRPQAIEVSTHGSDASNSPETGEDSFSFELSREEFLDMFFDDLELPHLVKKLMGPLKFYKPIRAGYVSTGAPTNINMRRTMRNALARKIAFTSNNKRTLNEAKMEMQDLRKKYPNNSEVLKRQQHKIDSLTQKINNIPFLDPFDVKYNRRTPQPSPHQRL